LVKFWWINLRIANSKGVKDFVTRFLYKKGKPDDSDNYRQHKDKRIEDEN